jgi:dihydrofolate synthase/folylpolyglutamate synthase
MPNGDRVSIKADLPAIQRVARTLDLFMQLHPTEIDLSLDRLYVLLDKMGNPHLRLPPVVHVAGTNGKGSTLAYCTAILEQAGYRVHRYTSPHLQHFAERIYCAGQIIDHDDLADVLEYTYACNAGGDITFFEATTAAAYEAFARVSADIVLLETGLGGRLDATNVFAAPVLCAITPISMDHTEFLGDSLAAIAREKAGIIKDNVPVFVGQQPEEVESVLRAVAKAHKAPYFQQGRYWQLADSVFVHADDMLPLTPALPGRHQIENAALAVAMMQYLRTTFPQITAAHMQAGIARAQWPGRLQAIAHMLPDVTHMKHIAAVYLDGGHNVAAANQLCEFMQTQHPDADVTVILGMLRRKNARDFLKALQPCIARFIPVALSAPDAFSAIELAQLAADVGVPLAATAPTMAEAFAIAGQHPSDVVLACGSLSVVGEVLTMCEKAEKTKA